LTLKNLHLALSGLKTAGVTIDLFGFDACLMSMVEIAYEFRTLAKMMLASEPDESPNGWPYDVILTHLAANPAMTAEQFGVQISNDYRDWYTAQDTAFDRTLAAISLAAMDDVATAFKALTVYLLAGPPALYAAIDQARQAATPDFSMTNYADACTFLDLLTKSLTAAGAPAGAAASTAASAKITAAVAACARIGQNVQGVCGMSIMYPLDDNMIKVLGSYDPLDFCGATNWNGFLRAMLTPLPVPARLPAAAGELRPAG
jgi:hypothetical protein